GSKELTDAVAEALAAWPGLATVRALDLGDNIITGKGIQALVCSPHFRPEYLQLNDTAISDAGARALAAWSGLANLITLDLSHSQLHGVGALALANSPHWCAIRHLRLTGHALTRDSLQRLENRVGSALDIDN